jgi:hypothetical protein
VRIESQRMIKKTGKIQQETYFFKKCKENSKSYLQSLGSRESGTLVFGYGFCRGQQ